jgi:hypothetical protein
MRHHMAPAPPLYQEPRRFHRGGPQAEDRQTYDRQAFNGQSSNRQASNRQASNRQASNRQVLPGATERPPEFAGRGVRPGWQPVGKR